MRKNTVVLHACHDRKLFLLTTHPDGAKSIAEEISRQAHRGLATSCALVTGLGDSVATVYVYNTSHCYMKSGYHNAAADAFGAFVQEVRRAA